MTENHLQRIRFLSSRFLPLQGLRVAAMGATLTAVMCGYLIATSQPTNNGALIALGVTGLLMIPGQWWAHYYYTSRFGRQRAKPKDRRYTLMFLAVYWVVAWCLHTWVPSIPAGAPTAMTVALYSSWVAIRDWPSRAYYAGATVAIVLAFAATSSGGGILPPNLTLVTVFLAVGVSLVPIGILDHLLLVRLLKEVGGLQAATAAERPSEAPPSE
jgi:hypothetical protein